MAKSISVPISLGELVDKITILEIKTKKLKDNALANAENELRELNAVLDASEINVDPATLDELRLINQNLWQIEDDIRDQERKKCFDEYFIKLARSVYKQNDRRAAIKRLINISNNSELIEEKSYKSY